MIGRLIQVLIALPIMLALVSFALHNRESVTVALWPFEPRTLVFWHFGIGLLVAGFVLGIVLAVAAGHGGRQARASAQQRVRALSQALEIAEGRIDELERSLAQAHAPMASPTAATTARPALTTQPMHALPAR